MTNDLKTLVGEINQYLDAIEPLWREAARRLMHITDNKLWTVEHKTYEDFVKKEWGKSKRWAYQLISSERVVQQLEANCKATSAQLCTPMSENAARNMGSVPQELRPAVIEHINHAHKPLTSTSIKEAQIVVTKKEKQLDSEGIPIPDRALPFWHRRHEISDALRAVSELRSNIRGKVESADKLWVAKATQRLLIELDTVYTTLKNFLPHTVCLQCGGHVASGHCESCHDTGLISKFHMDSFVSKTDLSIRKGQHVNSKTLPAHGV